MRNLHDIARFTRLAARCMVCSLAVVLALLLCTAATHAQVLQAKWVDESEKRIEEIRKADLRIIVLDKDGTPVPRCPVRIEQLRHAFVWGVRLPRELPQNLPTVEKMAQTPLWRSLNAVALDAHTKWPLVEPVQGDRDFTSVAKVLAFAKERNLSVRWGSIISTDPGRMPAWVAGLEGDALQAALSAHVKEVIARFGNQVDHFDVVTQMIDHRHIEKELGFAAIRQLYQLADFQRGSASTRADVPPTFARSTLAFDDAFAPARLQKALRQVTAFREGFVPFDALAIEVRFAGSLVEAPITRNLEWLGDPGLPVTVTNLEVAGDSSADASVNLETALRAMFSQPCVEGIYFAGLRGRDLQHVEAALLDDDGDLTPCGELVDRLVHQHWWTDVTASADDLGNVRQRIFAGSHRITATLPDGTRAQMLLRISPGQSRLILLQPTRAKPGATPIVSTVPPQAKTEDEPSLIEPVVDASFEPTEKEPATSTPPSPRDSKSTPVHGRARLEFTPQR